MKSTFRLPFAANRIVVLFIVFLFLSLPVASALQFSTVSANQVSANSATVSWQTDEAADSLVSYGTNPESLDQIVQSPGERTSHELSLTGLDSETQYYYSVQSNGEVDNNGGGFYSFMTLAQEQGVESSSSSGGEIALVVSAAERVAGRNVDVQGEALVGTTVRLTVNGGYFAQRVAQTQGTEDGSGSNRGSFIFADVPLQPDQSNVITLEATSSDGREEQFSQAVFSDTIRPHLTLEERAEFIDGSSINLAGQVSEAATVFIYLDRADEETLVVELSANPSFSYDLALEEGNNDIRIVAEDAAGWQDEINLRMYSDSEAPQVTAELEKGNEYFQNRARSTITGNTEAGSLVFLYVYEPRDREYSPSFDSPWAVVEADSEGNFAFENVNFEFVPVEPLELGESQIYRSPIQLEDLIPQEVPSGLESTSIPAAQSIDQAQSFPYHVFLIARDRTGKLGYWQNQVTVNSCFSDNFDFLVTDLVEYQAPLRLDPVLLEEGREEITAVFRMEYQGAGVSRTNLETGELVADPVQLNGVPQFELACTQAMAEDPRFGLGCRLLPRRPTEVREGRAEDGSYTYYVRWALGSAEGEIDREGSLWDQFQDSQLTFPLRININYQENTASGELGPSKTQSSCYDIGYFVDVPVDTEVLIPDWLADEGTVALNQTVAALDDTVEILEKIILVTGVTCVVSFLSRLVVRVARITASKAEPISSRLSSSGGDDSSDENESCPVDQSNLYLRETVESWQDLQNHEEYAERGLPQGWDQEENILEDRCPQTAGLWKAEAAIDQAYRWTCDRVYCRAVPAKWTETKEEYEIDTVVDQARQCSVSGSCSPLTEVENCRELVEGSTFQTSVASSSETVTSNTCWHDGNGNYYSFDGSAESQAGMNTNKGMFKLDFLGTINTASIAQSPPNLIVYKQPNTDGNFCSAPAQTCQDVCAARDGFEAVSDGVSVEPGSAAEGTGSCYAENDPQLSQLLRGGEKYLAGYSSDCFVDNQGSFYQCACQQTATELDLDGAGSRTAYKKDDAGVFEKYSYRQDQIHTESAGISGRYYPDWRFYAGRDTSASFGTNHLLDYLRPGNERFATVDPNTQYLSAFQTVCLSGVRSRIVMLRSILDGLNKCLEEAKYTGFQDAGMCKTLFTQHVCGLTYKALTFFGGQCTPLGVNDVDRQQGLFQGGIEAFSQAIQEGLQSSVDDLRADYGNADLNAYFSGGGQGLAQSFCSAAFGADFPLGFDFITDTAYSTSMATSALSLPVEREFSHYDPSTLNAVYNYEVGTALFPGCKIRSYQTSLKCIEADDLGRPGVDDSCSGQGCDCLYATGTSTFESDKTHVLDGGSGFNLEAGQMVDLPIPSPQKVNKRFRYDHVVVEVQFDGLEDVERCVAPEHRNGNGAIFYTPIKDVSAQDAAACSVNAISGEFVCSDIAGLFFGEEGLAYLEAPFLQCYDQNTGLYRDCQTSNLFLDGDEIIVKPYIYTDGAGYCLKLDVSAPTLTSPSPIPIPAGVSGQIQPALSLGHVSAEMFGSYQADLELNEAQSNNNCVDRLQFTNRPSTIASNEDLEFTYTQNTDSLWRLKVPEGVELSSSGYFINTGDRYLVKVGESNEEFISRTDLNAVVFSYRGFEFSNVLGGGRDLGTSGQCVYSTSLQRQSGSSARNDGSIRLEASLYQTDASGSCVNPTQLVGRVALGRQSYNTAVRVQQEHEVEAGASQIASLYEQGDYEQVIAQATSLITQREGELAEAQGIYYYVAATVMQHRNDLATASVQIQNLLNRFFLRIDSNGAALDSSFGQTTLARAEFQKYRQYLCEVASASTLNFRAEYATVSGSYGCNDQLPSASSNSGTSAQASGPICGQDPSSTAGFLSSFAAPSNWNSYSCQAAGARTDCLGYTEYAALGRNGCPDTQLCCPQN